MPFVSKIFNYFSSGPLFLGGIKLMINYNASKMPVEMHQYLSLENGSGVNRGLTFIAVPQLTWTNVNLIHVAGQPVHHPAHAAVLPHASAG